ncbi:hypothetical protein ABH935_007187 [Catenulispora sp. GAS73]|uniref:hypothetical protein n=1 Tax=Catenulispora sp. GAS73 TaxID=3156269 RepID=UPI003515F77C
MEAQQSSTEPQAPAAIAEAEEATKVFAPRIPVSMREQVEAIQNLTGQNVNEVGVEAIGMWITAKLADETLGAQAMAEIEAEQRRLDERRVSLAGVLGQRASATSVTAETEVSKPKGKRRV